LYSTRQAPGLDPGAQAGRNKIDPESSFSIRKAARAENVTGFRISFLSSRLARRKESCPE
jgi:hypothetical protein